MTSTSKSSTNLKKKAFISLETLACGDALGVPVEFLRPVDISLAYGKITHLVLPQEYHPHNHIPLGSVSDDTVQIVCFDKILVS